MSSMQMTAHIERDRSLRGSGNGALRTRRVGSAATFTLIAIAALVIAPTVARAQITLGFAQPFGVLGGSTVTNTGATTIKGDLGVYPGTAITGLGTITQNGAVRAGDAVAQQAQQDALTAYNALLALPFTTNLTGMDLGGQTLTPGIYFFASSAQLTGNLFLDFLGNPNALFVFQIGSTLTTASGSTVSVLNGGPGNGLFWQVGSSATLGTSSIFAGNILANTSITLTTGAKIICGRAIALNGAVTLDNNVVSNDCRNGGDSGTGRSDFGSAGFSGAAVVTIPEPSTLALLSPCVLALLGFSVRGRRASI